MEIVKYVGTFGIKPEDEWVRWEECPDCGHGAYCHIKGSISGLKLVPCHDRKDEFKCRLGVPTSRYQRKLEECGCDHHMELSQIVMTKVKQR